MPEAKAGLLDLREWDFEQDGHIRLDGEWLFNWGSFDIAPETAMIAQVPGVWTELPDPGASGNGKLPAHGFGVYRLRILLPGEQRLVFKTLDVSTAYDLLVNGESLARAGRVGSTAMETRAGSVPTLSEPRTLGPVIDLTIRAANFDERNGGVWDSVRMGRPADLRTYTRMREWSDITLFAGFQIIGLYYLVLFLLQRSDRSGLFFGLFCMILALRVVIVGERTIFQMLPDLDWMTAMAIAFASIFAANAAFIAYMRCLFAEEFQKRHARIADVYIGALLVLVLAVALTPMRIFAFTLDAWIIITLAGSLWLVQRLGTATLRGREGAGIALVSVTVMYLLAVCDGLNTALNLQLPYIARYGFLFFLCSQTFVFARRYVNTQQVAVDLAGQLDRKNRQLVSVDRMKDEFLANTSHELRSPLQGIIGIADSLKRGAGGAVTGETARQLEHIVRSGRRLTNLVNDLLDFSRLQNRDSAPIELYRSAVDLHAATAAVLELNWPRMPDRIELINDVPLDLPPVFADEDRIQQILHNLVENAIKFTRAGSVRISASVSPQQGMAVLAVEDSGIGIAPQDQERVFTPFVQIDGGIDRSRGGTGIGLSIIRELVRRHGGQIQLESDGQSGSRFTITLPLAYGSEAPDEASRKASSENEIGDPPLRPPDPTGTKTPPLGFPASEPDKQAGARTIEHEATEGGRILIVDDDPVIRQVMQNYLRLAGYHSEEAVDGEAALATLRIDPEFDAVVLDVMMPRISGFDVCRKLRKQHNALDLPVLMATARDRNEDLVAALNAGANDYLVKPIEREEFLLRLRNLLQVRRAHQTESRYRSSLRQAVKSERDRMNANLHDHLGAQLVDLRLLSRQLVQDDSRNPDLIARLDEEIKKTAAALREQMLFSEDLDLLSEDFPGGIRLLLMRRYMSADRELNFAWKGIPNSGEMLDSDRRAALYAVIKEIVTNDLKYGRDTPEWTFDLNPQRLQITLKSITTYNLSDHGSGRGTRNIVLRAAKLGGSVMHYMEGARIVIQLEFPVLIAARE